MTYLQRLTAGLTECMYSTQGCLAFPVRMMAVAGDEQGDDADATLILLCAEHLASYQPKGRVIFDRPLGIHQG